jgi:hypothetical protein
VSRLHRSWPATCAALGAVGAAAAVIAAAGARDSLTGYAVLALSVAAGLWLALRLGVLVDEGGLRIRRFGPARAVPWTAVDDIDCDVVAVHGLLGFYAPVLISGPDQIVVRTLGSYRREIADQRTRDLRVAYVGALATADRVSA